MSDDSQTTALTPSRIMRHQQQGMDGPIEDLGVGAPVPLNRTYLAKPSRPELSSRRSSTMSIAQIDQVLSEDGFDADTCGVSEIRDGLFDAIFLKPLNLNLESLLQQARNTLPNAFDKSSPLAAKAFLPRQLHQLSSLFRQITTTRAGIQLLKTFLAFFIAYVMCLVPDVRDWLGRYYYMMVISVILNHPARTIGAQIEGTIFTIVGTAIGLCWGVIGLLLSTSTIAASAGYGGILAMFLALFMLVMAWTRAFFIRFYQVVLCAGISIMFTTLAETNSQKVSWNKLRGYAVPWLFGQAIALLINLLIYPDAGARALAISLHQSLNIMQVIVEAPRTPDSRRRRRLATTFVDLSEACRDVRTSVTISRFRPDHAEQLRNSLQAVIRAFLSLEAGNHILEQSNSDECFMITVDCPDVQGAEEKSGHQLENSADSDYETAHASRRIFGLLQTHTKNLLSSMKEALQTCDAALMDVSGYRQYFGPSPVISSHIESMEIKIRHARAAFDIIETDVLNSKYLSISSIPDQTVVQLLVFARHVREAVSKVEALLEQVASIQRVSNWPKLYLPSYPIRKTLHWTNAQVRHDRGGVAAGSYQKTFTEIAHLVDHIKSLEYTRKSDSRKESKQAQLQHDTSHISTDDDTNARIDESANINPSSTKRRLRYKIWKGLYHLQGFESKYAFKVCLVTSLLSIPSYLPQSNGWWDKYEVWWVVVMSWAVMHPTVGGNLQDLVTRSLVAIFGAVWSGVGYAAGNGNPYVTGVFAAVYMAPMLYRYTISSHPRSGLAGCLSFTVVSLGLQAHGGGSSPAMLALLKGLSFFLGTAIPILVNWVLWPFVARHELRTALSSMMIFMSILYRDVVAKYVYFRDGKEPTPEDVQRSEILEGRLREGFVRIRQLLVLTRHEIRLRAPFDPLPYSALSDACERFFDYLITVRQSAIFYNPSSIRDDPVAAEQLLSYRRDAVAAILGNLYILAGALRSQRKVPLYMPCAAAARKRLLVKTAEVEELMSTQAPSDSAKRHKMWHDIYSYSYHESLTGCVAQLEELEKYTKIITGEQGFDDEFSDDDADEDT
ncbi:Zinc finger protein containing five transmembrane domains [Conoideocrella luteorostrata]|uniref:Zinc finger protein containing five transmembrane domains n=1 Tax=Conoideocrella luteorostrata TaxID=1105319 RepID=A0AAJ0CRS8_9HYPO|nr:Zinc finger protein containing five transmembrane domains [Conoideocrella luteorostrata]